ncbi:NmrA family NAD(P)-binding protein [uncultured Alsobacter sp.]|uniref:NmrA family NAD(P)-binding protein n=1 Tax=uncultured Alsobacter sp. TaxID=1748258 RepID=UPI0025E0ABEF|nr:NmrA family NAD(P)-binding protein [uncultured Alsobacter sp.]
MRRILVTGATGTVGGAVLKALAATADDDVQVLGASRSAAGDAAIAAAGHAAVRLDYDAPATLRPAMDGVDALFLATGYTVDMLVQSKRALDAAKAAGVRHVVHLGALAADDTPLAHFAWHQLIERAIEAMGFSWTHLRPNFFIDTAWAGVRARPDRIVHFVADRPVSWIASDDIAAVAAVALADPAAHAGKAYPLASERATFAQVASVLSEVTGRAVEYRPRPAAELFAILQRQGMEPVYAKSLAEGLVLAETGDLPLADAVFPTVEEVTGRPATTWRAFAAARLSELPRAS